MSFKLDAGLRQYATDRQWELMQAWEEHGSIGKAAKALGFSKALITAAWKRLRVTAAKHGCVISVRGDKEHNPLAGRDVPEGLTTRFVSTRFDGDGDVSAQWHSVKPEGLNADETPDIPDPRFIKRTSKLYDQDGKVTQHWVTEEPDLRKRDALWQQFAEGLRQELPIAEPVALESRNLNPDLLASYPVGDHHLGMLAWAKETGADYDLKIGEQMFTDAMDYLVEAAPAAETGLLAILGDFVHYDSMQAMTPTSHNMLDSDTRFPKMVPTAMRCLRFGIERLLRKHARVHVIVEIGNHDLTSSIWLMQSLKWIYEANDRVWIDISPKHFHYMQFGKVLIATHHGHGTKPMTLPGIMANDVPDMWGATKHRYWYIGHLHHLNRFDMVGCTVEQFRVLASQDAWAANKGYRSTRDMQQITYHREFGERARNIVTPEMFAKAA